MAWWGFESTYIRIVGCLFLHVECEITGDASLNVPLDIYLESTSINQSIQLSPFFLFPFFLFLSPPDMHMYISKGVYPISTTN